MVILGCMNAPRLLISAALLTAAIGADAARPSAEVESRIERAATAMRVGDYARAARHLNRALRAAPNHAEALMMRGLTHRKLKKYDAALRDFDRAVAFDPENPRAYAGRGHARYRLKKYAAALADYDHLLKLMPTDANAHRKRAHALRKLKRLDEAMAAYDAALRLDPEHAGVHFDRAKLRLAVDGATAIEAARVDLHRAVELARERDPKLAAKAQAVLNRLSKPDGRREVKRLQKRLAR